MKPAKRRSPAPLSKTASVLIRELCEECENVVRLIKRLEAPAQSEPERDDVLGELSAAVLHLHTHTEGLDELLCKTK